MSVDTLTKCRCIILQFLELWQMMIKDYRVVVWKEDLTYLLQEIIRAGE
jgi:hypothetical protein